MAKRTDAELLDWLEAQNAAGRYTGRCVFRLSGTGRGWRLHETSGENAVSSVRTAIADAIDRDEREKGGD